MRRGIVTIRDLRYVHTRRLSRQLAVCIGCLGALLVTPGQLKREVESHGVIWGSLLFGDVGIC